MKQRLLARIHEIKTGDSTKISTIEDKMVRIMKPKKYNYYDRDNEELKYDLSFEEMVHGLREHSPNKDIKLMTVMEVYSLLEFQKKKYDALKKK